MPTRKDILTSPHFLACWRCPTSLFKKVNDRKLLTKEVFLAKTYWTRMNDEHLIVSDCQKKLTPSSPIQSSRLSWKGDFAAPPPELQPSALTRKVCKQVHPLLGLEGILSTFSRGKRLKCQTFLAPCFAPQTQATRAT